MGAALADASRAARDTFAEVDEALGQNLFRLMREGPDDELKLTENAQPAIMAHSIAVLRTLGVELPNVANFVAGHSLGEYSALVAAGMARNSSSSASAWRARSQARVGWWTSPWPSVRRASASRTCHTLERPASYARTGRVCR